MAGPSIFALLETEFGDAELAEADALLARLSSKIARTRRGRVWDVWVAVSDGRLSGAHSYHVSIQRIDQLEEEDMELLAANDKPEDSVRERLVVSAGVNSRFDYTQITLCAEHFVAKFRGLAGVAVK